MGGERGAPGGVDGPAWLSTPVSAGKFGWLGSVERRIRQHVCAVQTKMKIRHIHVRTGGPRARGRFHCPRLALESEGPLYAGRAASIYTLVEGSVHERLAQRRIDLALGKVVPQGKSGEHPRPLHGGDVVGYLREVLEAQHAQKRLPVRVCDDVGSHSGVVFRH